MNADSLKEKSAFIRVNPRTNHLTECFALQRLLWFLLLVLLLSITCGVSLGAVPIPLANVWGIAADRLGLSSGGAWSTAQVNIVWLIRFPRVLLAAFVGGGLALLLGTLYLVLQARALNALLMGDESATGVGIDVTRLRRTLFVVTSLITGVLVAVSGSIGFIGLVVPHMVRGFVGSDHRRVLPMAALVGSVFLIWVDVIARTAFDPVELPVGVITALLGGLFFLWLLWRQG